MESHIPGRAMFRLWYCILKLRIKQFTQDRHRLLMSEITHVRFETIHIKVNIKFLSKFKVWHNNWRTLGISKLKTILVGSVPANPLSTFRPQNQFVPLDEPARLYCEAFVGKVKLPDARSTIAWYQVFENDNEQEVDGEQETITR